MLTNQQRKIFLTYLTGLATDDWESTNRFIAKDKYWLLTTDRLIVNREDGSCSSINARLIDPIILEGLHDRLYMGYAEILDNNNDATRDQTGQEIASELEDLSDNARLNTSTVKNVLSTIKNEDLIECSCGMCDDVDNDNNDKTINVWGKDPQWTKNRNLQTTSL